MPSIIAVIAIIVALVLGILAGYIVRKSVGEREIGSAETKAKNIILDAEAKSETIQKEIALKAQEEADQKPHAHGHQEHGQGHDQHGPDGLAQEIKKAQGRFRHLRAPPLLPWPPGERERCRPASGDVGKALQKAQDDQVPAVGHDEEQDFKGQGDHHGGEHHHPHRKQDA